MAEEIEELKNIEQAPSTVKGYMNIFPTQHLEVQGWVFSHREGARLPDVKTSLSMELPESRESINVAVIFLGTTGSPWSIFYLASTVTEVVVTRRPKDGWGSSNSSTLGCRPSPSDSPPSRPGRDCPAVFGCNLRRGGRPLFAPGGVFSLY